MRAGERTLGVEKMHLFVAGSGLSHRLCACRRAYAASRPQPAAERICQTIFRSRTPADRRRTTAGDG